MMGVSTIRSDAGLGYITRGFQGVPATTHEVTTDDVQGMNKLLIFSRRPKWLEWLIKQERFIHAERGTYEDEYSISMDRDTASTVEVIDESTYEYPVPTEYELRVAKLTNTPSRGFCISADIEKITADSYDRTYDPDEFSLPNAPDI